MTQHTFIAWVLSEGANMMGPVEYCGTSVQMIEQLRQVHPRGLPRASNRGPSIKTAKGSSWRKNRTPFSTQAVAVAFSGIGRAGKWRSIRFGLKFHSFVIRRPEAQLSSRREHRALPAFPIKSP